MFALKRALRGIAVRLRKNVIIPKASVGANLMFALERALRGIAVRLRKNVIIPKASVGANLMFALEQLLVIDFQSRQMSRSVGLKPAKAQR